MNRYSSAIKYKEKEGETESRLWALAIGGVEKWEKPIKAQMFRVGLEDRIDMDSWVRRQQTSQ